mmetsp:Transcript_36332/g.71507  ORF Transcript_36332/g.71507 Transcript_36332/m.71507 type:complete len:95 (+) Transcript_36332:615-899(+)
MEQRVKTMHEGNHTIRIDRNMSQPNDSDRRKEEDRIDPSSSVKRERERERERERGAKLIEKEFRRMNKKGITRGKSVASVPHLYTVPMHAKAAF